MSHYFCRILLFFIFRHFSSYFMRHFWTVPSVSFKKAHPYCYCKIRASLYSHGTTLIIIYFLDNISFSFNAACADNLKFIFGLPTPKLLSIYLNFRSLQPMTSVLFKLVFKCTSSFSLFLFIMY